MKELLLICVSLFFLSLEANSQVSFDDNETLKYSLIGNSTRDIIPFKGKQSQIEICELEVDENYIIEINQIGDFTPKIALFSKGKFGQEITFRAEKTCEKFTIKLDDLGFHSGNQLTFAIAKITQKTTTLNSELPNLSVSGSSASNLISNVLIGGDCFDVTGITLSGNSNGIGSFSNGLTSIGLDQGVIISTGNINNAPGPNNQTNASTNFPGISTDPDLQQLAGNTNVRERVMIEFDFQPTSDTVTFRYAFASEEYCDFVNAGYNDVFGFFISGAGLSGPFSNGGVNLAVLPNGGGGVTIDNVNWSTNSSFYVDNVPVGQNQNANGCTNAELNNPAYAPNDIEFDGFTVVLTSTAVVIPCSTYHIKLAVGDVGDGIYDSAVFLEANSFDAGGQARGEAFSATTGTNIVYEPCADGVINFEQVGGDPNLPFVIHFDVDPSSTATEGVDYAMLPDSVVIPAGSNTFSLPITVFADNIAEGQESIIITLSNPCNCNAGTIELLIEDPPPLEVSLSPQTFCGPPGSITLNPSVSGGVPSTGLNYSWSNGSSSETISVSPTMTDTYVVTVTDGCNGLDTASATITILDQPTANISGSFDICSEGDVQPVDIPVNFTGTPPWTFVYVLDGVPQPAITTSNNPYIISLSQPSTVTLESVSDPAGLCPGTVSGSVTVNEVIISPNPIISDVNCTGGSDGTIEITVNGGTSPYTYAWSNGGSGAIQTDLPADTYFITVTDANGCEGETSATVEEPPPPPPFNAFPDDQTICGLNPTTLTPNVSGGVSPYVYSWDDGSSGSSITVTPNGAGIITNQVTITDDCGNTAITNVSAEFFEEPTANISGNFEICAQGNIQPVDIIINFTGNPPWEFIYAIDGVQQAPITTSTNPYILTTSQPGTYTLISLTVAGENCPGVVSGQASLDEVTITPSATATDETCFAQGDGSVTANGGGGTAPYTYNWSNGSSNQTQNNLPIGTYFVTVTDNNGCTEETSATIGGPPDLSASANSPSASTCSNPNGGSVSVSPTGGTPSYTYNWSNGSTSQNPTNVPPGIYDVTVTDANGCTTTAQTEVLDDTTPPIATASAIGQLDCINQTITISGIGSSVGSGIIYNWTGPGIVSGAGSLNPIVDQIGTYNLVVTNTNNGCTAEATAVVSGDQTPPIAIASGGEIDCNNQVIQIDGTGSTTGGNTTFQWSGPGIVSGANTLTPTVSQGGTYTLTVVNNDNGCTAEAYAFVTANVDLPTAVAQSDPLTCVITQVTIDGNGSSVGSNISYEWTPVGGNIISGGNTLNPTVDEAGTYILTVTNDQTGCSSQTQVDIPLNNIPPAAATTTPLPITCINTTTEIFPFGTSTGPNIIYQWTGPGIVGDPTVYQPTVDAPGTYTLVVTDTDNGCTASAQVDVPEDLEEPEAIATGGYLDCNFEETTLDGSQSTSGAFISYQWITTNGNFVSGQNTPNPVVDEPGNYILIIINDQNGCTNSTTVDVTQNIDEPTVDAGPIQLLTCIETETFLDATNTPIGGNIQFEWMGPGIIGGANTLTPEVNQIGTYEIIVTDNGNGCTNSDFVEVELDSEFPIADAGTGQELNCGNPSVFLDGLNSSVGNEYIYNWTTQNGNIIAGQGSLTPEVDGTGLYELTVTNLINGCTEVASVEVTDDFDFPEIAWFDPEIIDCSNFETIINASLSSQNGDFTYQWSTNDGNIVSGQNSLEPLVDQPGTYTLSIFNNENQCESIDDIFVDADLEYPTPDIIDPATLNCAIGQVVIDGSNSSTGNNLFYEWTTTDGNIVNGQNSLQPTVDSSGTYTLTILNLQNSCSVEASVTVEDDLSTPTASAGDPDILNCTIEQLILDGDAGGSGTLDYQWSTPNGNIISGENTLNPMVNEPGNYMLTVTNLDNDCIAESSVTITEDVIFPVADAGASATINCYNPTLNLDGDDSSIGTNIEYQWSTPDGNILNGSTTLTPEIDEPGTYILVVTNNQNTCIDTAEVLIDLNNEVPIAGTGPNQIMGCGVTQLELEGTASSSNPILNYYWDTPSGNIVSGSNTLNPIIDEPGTYTLTVSDPFNGCESTSQVEITQNTETPVVASGPGGEINCTTSELTLQASATGQTQNFSIQWNTSDGNIVSGGNTLNPTIDAGGTYELIVIDTTNNCQATASLLIDEDANIPLAEILPNGGLNCVSQQVVLDATTSTQGNGITYQWSTPNGNFVNGQTTLSPQIDAPGIYTLSIFDSNNNCESTETITIPLDTLSPNVNLTGGILTCDVQSITIDADTNGSTDDWSISWVAQTGAIDSGDDSLTPTVSTPGIYALTTLNNTNGCTAETSIEVTQYIEYPSVDAEEPDILTCVETEVVIDASASSNGQIFDYQWNTLDGNIVSGANTLEPIVDEPGMYDLIITNTVNGCSSTLQSLVNEDVELPAAVANPIDELTCDVLELNLDGNGSEEGDEYTYQWTTNNGNIVSDETTLSPVIDAPGTYEILVTNTLTSCVSVATVEVQQDIINPIANAGDSPELTCDIQTLQLNGTLSSNEPIMVFDWSTNDGNIIEGENTLTPTISQPGYYDLLVTNTENGCTSLAQVEVTQDVDLPLADAGEANDLTCVVFEIMLDGSNSQSGQNIDYQWSTNDGNIVSGIDSIAPIVNQVGTYELTVTNLENGCSSISTVEVVNDLVAPNAEAGETAELNCVVETLELSGLNSSAGQNYIYEWATSNGNIVAGANTLAPVVDAPGTYEILVTNSINGCTSVDEVEITQSVDVPIVSSAVPDVLTCEVLEIQIDALQSSQGNQFQYNWTTSDGNIINGGNSLTPTVNQPGTYQLVIINDTNGCENSLQIEVQQDIVLPVAEAGQSDDLTCEVLEVNLNGENSSSGVNFSYEWTTTNGNILNGENTLYPSVNEPGIYQLLVTNTTNGCTILDDVEVILNDVPPIIIVAEPNILTCSVLEINVDGTGSDTGTAFEYSWTTSDGNILSGNNDLIASVSEPGTYNLLITNNINGCTQAEEVIVSQDIQPPTADAGDPFILNCIDDIQYLDGSDSQAGANIQYEWDTPNGNIANGQMTTEPGITIPGTYNLVVTNLENGCTAVDQVIITEDIPLSELAVEQPPCHDDFGAISFQQVVGGTPPYVYSMDGGGTFFDTQDFTNISAGQYNLIVQDINGCEDEKLVNIYQPNEVVVDIDSEVELQLGDTYQVNTFVNLSPNQISEISWTPSEGLSCDDCLNPIITPLNTVVYTISVKNENGCEDKENILIRVDKEGGVYIPNAFSPNGDGINDKFLIYGKLEGIKEIKSFLVFSRWGESVWEYQNFQPNDPASGWDGMHRGQLMNPAVFAYFAEIEFIDGTVKLFEGDVTLTR
jgi:gliding motility-associated-like protein